MSKKVLLFIFNLAPGGAERVLVTLANGLNRAGCKVTICTIERETSSFYKLDQGVTRWSLSDINPPSTGNLFGRAVGALRRLANIRKMIQTERPSTVISFVGPLNVIVLLSTFWMRERPQIVVSERNDPQKQKLAQPLEWLRRKLYRHADLVTANTQGAVDHMQCFVPAAKLMRIPNPVTVSGHISELESIRKLIVLNIARLHPQKGQDILLTAFAGLPDFIKAEWALKIIGTGSELDNLRQIARANGLAESVITGQATNDPWAEYLKAGIFVLPSRFEGLPNVLLEAMSAGCACVVSDASPGPLEFLKHEHSGLVFPSGDVSALTSALEQLINDPDLRNRLGQNARAAVADLSEDNVLDEWVSILR